jgi:hypothetical protein
MKRHNIILALTVVCLALGAVPVLASVGIAEFSAAGQTNQITLSWTTGNEVNNVGFNVYSSTVQAGPYTHKLNATLIPSQCFGCVGGTDYSLVDKSAAPNKVYYYKLESVDTSGGTQQFGPVSASLSGPSLPATPTLTPMPSPTTVKTATPTFTPPPSATPLPSNTPLPTSTVTALSTATPIPTLPPAATATTSVGAQRPTSRPSNTSVPAADTPLPLDPAAIPSGVPALATAIPALDSSPTPDIRVILRPTRVPTAAPAAAVPVSGMGSAQPLLVVGILGMLGVGGAALAGFGALMFIWIARERRR